MLKMHYKGKYMKFKKSITMHSQDIYKCKIPVQEAIEAMNDDILSSGAFKLLVYYYCKSTGWVFKDSEIARDLNRTERRVAQLRKELIDNEYLLIDKGGISDVYFIGKKAVAGWKQDEDSDLGAVNENIISASIE